MKTRMTSRLARSIFPSWEGNSHRETKKIFYAKKAPRFHWRFRRLPIGRRINIIAWRIYLIKIADLADTVMFALRKKYDQISFLHVFHHCLMALICMWFIRSLDKDSMGYFLGLGLSINTTVHMIVYFYYGLAAFGPHMNKYLWWKKYLTQFQMVQFCIVLGYLAHGWATGCEDYGKLEVFFFTYVVVIFILFLNFYRKYKN